MSRHKGSAIQYIRSGKRFCIFYHNARSSRHRHKQQIAFVFDLKFSQDTDQSLSLPTKNHQNAKHTQKFRLQTLDFRLSITPYTWPRFVLDTLYFILKAWIQFLTAYMAGLSSVATTKKSSGYQQPLGYCQMFQHSGCQQR